MPEPIIPIMFDVASTLAELESLKPASYTATYSSSLAQTVAALHEKPLRLFTIEDFRVMIGQQRFLEYLVPLALNALVQNPLAEGDYHAGDLLLAVIKVKEYWSTHQDHKKILEEIVTKLLDGHQAGYDGEADLNLRYITQAWEDARKR